MPFTPAKLQQTLIDGEYCLVQISVTAIEDAELAKNPELLDIFNNPAPLGLSAGYDTKNYLAALAIANNKNCCIVEFKPPKFDRKQGTRRPLSDASVQGRAVLQERILCREIGDRYAFDMAPIAMSLASMNLRVVNAVDIQSAYPIGDRRPESIIREAVGNDVKIFKENIVTTFENPVFDKDDRNCFTDLAMRAWVSQFLAGYKNAEVTFADVKRIDTLKLTPEMISMIAKVVKDRTLLDLTKPMERTLRGIAVQSDSNGNMKLFSPNFANRFQGNENVRVKTAGQNGDIAQRSKMGGRDGTAAIFKAERDINQIKLAEVRVMGRDGPTPAERRRDTILLRILQGEYELLEESSWVTNLWFPNADGCPIWPDTWEKEAKEARLLLEKQLPESLVGNLARLNDSQKRAINTMVSLDNAHRLVLIQGPPGTGKTSVIAAYVQMMDSWGFRGIWLVAKSNVAVRNIAEKLLSVGFTSWRLIVSSVFKDDWHEHLYEAMSSYVITSSGDQINQARSQLRNCSVMLSTLDMLSNSTVKRVVLSIVPLHTLIVDEASQIEIGNYIPVFSEIKTLRKVCFIGDPKQLPPYGQEEIEDLQSIFEIEHLMKSTLLLETQYRMPPHLGRLISKAVYEDKLQSNPGHPIKDTMISCYFVDAPGNEMKTSTDSYKNETEKQVVLQLAQHLQNAGKRYKIITPYEGQRSAIENEMKTIEGLDWGDKCFNVDSFQGNEEDYIIISIVRSRELGFLANLRRTNVMLTRCKKGMFIVTSEDFIMGPGATSLVSQLAHYIPKDGLLSKEDVENGTFLDNLERNTLQVRVV